jgi:transposase
MGRSRGGLTTKIHAVVDAEGMPIALKLSEGQAHDGRSAADLLGTVREGNILLADRAYASDVLRQTLADRGAWANIRPMPSCPLGHHWRAGGSGNGQAQTLSARP